MDQRTTLKYQLIELLAEVHLSLTILLEEPTTTSERGELTRLHYDVLDGSSAVLVVLHMPTSTPRSSAPSSEEMPIEPTQSLVMPSSLSENDLFKIIADLMDSRHPTTFRQSFVRLAIMVSFCCVLITVTVCL